MVSTSLALRMTAATALSKATFLTTTTATIIPSFRFLSAWFCPYAHRATLALEHHRDRIQYEWVEALGWEIRKTNKSDSHQDNEDDEDQREWYYHWKADELKRANPSALVPTLIPIIDGQADESKSVYESLIVVDYIDDMSGASGTDRLVPYNLDPYQVARCRRWCDKVNRECCSPYYGVLVPQNPDEQMQHFQQLLRGIREFAREVQSTPGPLFLPNGQLSNVDIALFPWAYRYYVLEHYRGSQFRIPKLLDHETSPHQQLSETDDDESSVSLYQVFHDWYQAMMDIPAVQRTLPDRDRYLQHIANYANGSARSKVANAVRRGAAAHELDDHKDG